ncbi:MAG: hypothetical protein D6690_04335 [Nitrospirae bacterium]|nr:MAG: hypothetical protein D6690_04335 [Nitrospirota bacterium]
MYSQASGLWLLVFVLCAVQTVWIVRGPVPFADGGLVDPDSFMRLNRVLQLADSGEWFATRYPRSNAPYGQAWHWTRPLDVVLLIGAGLASLVVPFKTGLHYWAVVVSPVIQFFTLVSVLWMVRPFFDRDHQLLCGGLFLLQPGIMTYFFAGRPDHHSLLLMCFVLLLGLTLRMTGDSVCRSTAIQAGIVGGLAIWISVEALVAVALALGVLAVGWLRSGQNWTSRMAWMTSCLWGVISLALLVEHGPGNLFVEEYDRVSIVHWTVLTALAGFWGAIAVSQRYGLALPAVDRRLVAGLIGGLMIACVQWSLFPKFFFGPLIDVDPRILRLVWDRVSETQPLVSTNPWQFGRLIFHLGIALPAFPYLLWCLWSDRDSARQWLWILLCAGSIVYGVLACMELRWVPYAGILLIIPYARMIGYAFQRLAVPLNAAWQPIVKAGIVMAGCTWPLLFGAALMAAENSMVGGTTPHDCPLIPLSAYLSDPRGMGTKEQTILAFIDFGPELLYRTPHRVVATPYHRNARGILDAYTILASDDETIAKKLMDTRHIDLIVLCPTSPTEPSFYRESHGDQALYSRLEYGQVPSWLKAIALPSPLAAHFKLFQVVDHSERE